MATPKNTSDLTSGNFREAVPFLSRRELTLIQDPEEIRAFFQCLALDQDSVPVTVASPTAQSCSASLQIHADQQLRITFSDRDAATTMPLDNAMTVIIRWRNRTYSFVVPTSKSNGDISAFLPSKVYVVHRRFWDRHKMDDHKWSANLTTTDNAATGSVTDITNRGVAIVCNNLDPIALFETGTLRIAPPSHSELELSVEIVHVTQQVAGALVGCRIQDSSLHDFRRLYSLAASLLHPDIINVGSDEDRVLMNLVLQNSCVGGSRPTAPPARAERTVSEPKGAYFLLKASEGGGAVLGGHQLYDQTWLIHTLGLTKEYSAALPTRLFERLGNYLVGEMDAAYVCGFWPAQSRVLDRSYTAFVKQDFHPSDHHLEVVHMMQFRTDASTSRPAKPEIQISGLGPKDWATTKEILRRSCSEIFWDANQMENIFSASSSVDRNHSRIVMLAKQNERIVGVAVMERALRAPVTFGLSNHCRLFFAENVDTDLIGRNLFHEVLRVYKASGIPAAMLYVPEADTHTGTWPGLVGRVDRIYFWISKASRAKAFLRHLDQLDWELRFLDRHRTEIKPSLLKKCRFQSEPFHRRQTSRLEGATLVSGVRCDLVLADGRSINVPLTSLDPYGCSIQVPGAIRTGQGERYHLKLRVPGDTPIEVEGEVRYVVDRAAPGFSAVARFVGFHFSAVSPSSARVLREYAFRQLNPELAIFQKEDYPALTSLFERSDYFSYYEGADHKRFIKEGEKTYSDLGRLYPDLTRITVLKEDEHALGSHSFYRLTPRTWQLHQLVVDESRSLYKAKIPTKVILQGSFQYLTLDPTADYFVTYFHDEAAIAKTYFDVRNHHDNSRDYAFISFRGYLFENLSTVDLTLSGQVNIREATDEDLDEITGYLETLVSRIEYDALDFGDLRQNDFLGRWKQRGFDRERKVFVARGKKGEMYHFAIANVSPQGSNLISLLDIYRIFDLPWCGSVPEIARLDLARYVTNYYRQLGRTQAYLEVDEAAGPAYTALPARDLGKNWRLVAARPAFMTALHFFLSRFEKLEKRLVKQSRKSEKQPTVS